MCDSLLLVFLSYQESPPIRPLVVLLPAPPSNLPHCPSSSIRAICFVAMLSRPAGLFLPPMSAAPPPLPLAFSSASLVRTAIWSSTCAMDSRVWTDAASSDRTRASLAVAKDDGSLPLSLPFLAGVLAFLLIGTGRAHGRDSTNAEDSYYWCFTRMLQCGDFRALEHEITDEVRTKSESFAS